MNRWIGKIAVVTGASSGIGLVTSKTLVEEGMIVIGLARRKTKMEESMKDVKGKGKFFALECDIMKEESVKQVFASIKQNFGSVHILINNAGKSTIGSLIDTDISALEQTISLNILGILYCTREAVKIMRVGKHEGHIINIGSAVGHKVPDITTMNIYPASKFAVRALTESLKNELLGLPIRVTHISPGIVKTDFFDHSGHTFLDSNPGLNPEDVADAIAYVIKTKPHVNIPELTIKHLQDHHK